MGTDQTSKQAQDSAMNTPKGSGPSIAVTHFAGRAGDHNDHAMAASPRLAAALADHYRVTPFVIGSPRPARSTTWDIELAAARDELTQMRDHYQINSSLAVLTFMQHQSDWHIECERQDIADFVHEQIANNWTALNRGFANRPESS